MQKSVITAIIILFTLLNVPVCNSQQSKENKNILILLSFSPSQPAYKIFIDEIRQKLIQEFGDAYTMYMEYLETEKYPEANYPKERFDLYNETYRKIKLDLLICIGVNVISPIKKYGESYLFNLPTISLDYDFSELGYYADLTLNDQTAVLDLKLDFEATLSYALKLFPKTSSIYFISGVARFDNQLSAISEKAAEKIKGSRNITFIKDTSMDDIVRMVHNLPENSLVFVTSFIMDKKLVPYYNPDAIRIISRESNAPVFHYNSIGIGSGSVGGYILSFQKVGQQIGESAVKILKGINPNSIEVTQKEYYEYLFDWRQLKRWNIANSDLIPKESTILFKDVNLLEEYKWVLGAVLLFLVLQSMLIANLIHLNRNQKLMTKKIIETENKYREFLHEDRSLRLGQLTASLSHELNQPLTAILSNAQAGINFVNSNEATPELLKEIFQKIVDNDKRGASILGSIRGMLKLESREKEKINLNALINEVAAVLHSEATRLNTKLNIELTDEKVNVLADGIQIQQVLLNFILNALQSMEKINSSIKIITVSLSKNNEDVIVSVRDRGKGIDEGEMEKLFKPFITSKKEGTGIGLAICRSIIEEHKGKIWAENMTDGGAKFSFSLKILKDEQDQR